MNAAVVSSHGQNTWCKPKRTQPKHSCCIALEDPPERPDPASYSQQEQLALGNIPTWNSPDITTNQWSPFRLLPEANVLVRNLSGKASAINVLVHLYTSPFGIGAQRSLMATQMVSLVPLQGRTLSFPFSQEALAGPQTIGVFTRIEHPTDSQLINNNGGQVHHGVHTSESGRTFSFKFPVLNNQAASRQIALSALPNDLGATVTPDVRAFAPWEQITATLACAVPGALHGTPGAYIQKEVTVIGRYDDGTLIGGLTYVIRVND